MAETMPINLPTPASSALISYNFTDIAEGTGIVVFYGAMTTDDGTTTYLMTANTLYSDKPVTYGVGSGSADEKVLDLDFDTGEFNIPQYLYGTARIQIPVIYGDEATANRGGQVYAIVKIRKYDGSTETEIASNTKSRVTASVGNNDTVQDILLVEIPITTRTLISEGDKIRVTIELYTATAATTQIGLLHDPNNRSSIDNDSTNPGYYPGGIDTSEFKTSVLEMHIPFERKQL